MAWNPWKSFKNQINSSRQWLKRTPERAIYKAFQAAISIKKIEDEFFNGEPIADTAGYSTNTYRFFRLELSKNLQTIRTRLAEYQLSASLPFTTATNAPVTEPFSLNQFTEKPSLVQQLAFIDFILTRYLVQPSQSISAVSQPVQLLDQSLAPPAPPTFTLITPAIPRTPTPVISPIEKTIIPTSFFRVWERLRRMATGAYFGYERDFVDELRQSRKRTLGAIWFVLYLLAIVVITQIIAKNLLFSPLVDKLYPPADRQIQFNLAVREKAMEEYRLVRDRWEFQHSINQFINDLDTERKTERERELQTEMKKELGQILATYNNLKWEGLKNLGADVSASLAGYLFLLANRRQLAVLKEFVDEILYNLNDSAKAFMIIVATDTFVGFHSSDGWDALLFVIFSHFSIPENQIMTKTFIAIVPVFLDGLFKFWIFQYLRQSSPATATIFSEMNQ